MIRNKILLQFLLLNGILMMISCSAMAQEVHDEIKEQTTTTISPRQPESQQQSKISNEYNITIDEQGNADVVVQFTLNSNTWKNRELSGTFNPEHAKQKIIKSVPRLYITSIDYIKDSTAYSDQYHIKAKGVAQLDEDGRWKTYIGELPPNTFNVGGNTYSFRIPIPINNDTLWQIQHVKLPANAKDARIEKDSFDNSWISYSLKADWGKNAMPILGGLLILAGIGWAVKRRTS